MARTFIGGKSTKLEVDELMKLELVVGMAISYEEIENITNTEYPSSRFKTVTNTWRAKLRREKGTLLKPFDRKFYVLSADDIQDEGGRRLHRIGRATGRLIRDVGLVKPAELSSDERRAKHLLMEREARAVIEAVQKSARALLSPPLTTGGPRLYRGV